MYWTLHNRGSWNVGFQRPPPSKKSLALFVHHLVHCSEVLFLWIKVWDSNIFSCNPQLPHWLLLLVIWKKETMSSSKLFQPGFEQYQYYHYIIIAVVVLKDLSLFLLSKSTRQDMRPASRRKPPETKKLTLYCSVASKIQPGYMLDL